MNGHGSAEVILSRVTSARDPGCTAHLGLPPLETFLQADSTLWVGLTLKGIFGSLAAITMRSPTTSTTFGSSAPLQTNGHGWAASATRTKPACMGQTKNPQPGTYREHDLKQ